MDVLLVGPRGRSARSAELAAEVEALARSAARDGDRVRLLQPVEVGGSGDGHLPATLGDRLRVAHIPSATPPFRSVVARLVDIPLERALNEELREHPPELVHMHGYGDASSYLVPWLSDRLGVPAVVHADPIEAVLCHRGTLIDRDGAACRTFDDAARCARCCRAHDEAALGPIAAFLATCMRPLRGLTPFPNRNAMRNRIDLLVHGLASARLVCVRDPSAAADLIALGVPERSIQSGVAGADTATWRAIWQQARG